MSFNSVYPYLSMTVNKKCLRSSMLETDQRYAETESECESKLSGVNEAYEASKGQMEVRVRNLQEEVASLRRQLKASNHDDRDDHNQSFIRWLLECIA